MKTVNLLPGWYLQERRSRKQVRMQLLLLAILLLIMAAWVVAGRREISALATRRDQLSRQADLVRNLGDDVDKSRHELQRLEDLQLAYHDLGASIPMSAVVRQITNDMTPGMALSKINVDVLSEAVKIANTGDPKRDQKFHNVAHMVVVGVAPNDIQMSQLIEKLSRNPLFKEVTLNYSRTEIIRQSLVRRFEIQMQMDLDKLSIVPREMQAQAQQGGGNAAKKRVPINRMIMAGLFAASVLLFAGGGYLPYAIETRSLRQQIKQRQQELAQSSGQSAQLQDLTHHIGLMRLQVANYDRLVPESQELGIFLSQLTHELDNAGMRDTAVRAASPTPLGRCEQLPIEIKGAGTFPQVNGFLERLETMPRLCSVSKLSIESDQGLSGNVSVDIILSIYNARPQ